MRFGAASIWGRMLNTARALHISEPVPRLHPDLVWQAPDSNTKRDVEGIAFRWQDWRFTFPVGEAVLFLKHFPVNSIGRSLPTKLWCALLTVWLGHTRVTFLFLFLPWDGFFFLEIWSFFCFSLEKDFLFVSINFNVFFFPRDRFFFITFINLIFYKFDFFFLFLPRDGHFFINLIFFCFSLEMGFP